MLSRVYPSSAQVCHLLSRCHAHTCLQHSDRCPSCSRDGNNC